MTASVHEPFLRALDSNGTPQQGYALYVYEVNSTTLRDVFSDKDLAIPASNPAESDASGYFPKLYLSATVYKLVMKDDVGGATVWTADYLEPGVSVGAVGALAALNTVSNAVSLTGSVVQSARATYATNTNISANIPTDDTIPQVSEGTEIISMTIAPRSTVNVLEFDFKSFVSCSVAAKDVSVALFSTASVNAVAAATVTPATSLAMCPLSFNYSVVPNSTATLTYAVRAGPSTTANMRFNGTPAARVFGGVGAAALFIKEIKV